MHLILNVHSSNPETDLDCGCALLELTKPFCDRLRRDIETLFRHLRELPDLYEVYFWRYAVEFYSFDLIAACDDCEAGWSGPFEKAGRSVLPKGVDLAKFEPQRMECQQEIIRYVPAASNIVRLPENCFEICWTAVPKHSDTYYHRDTPVAVIDVLEQARQSGTRIRLHYGNAATGRDWLDEFDVEGTLSRSMGPMKVPILLANKRSWGGPQLLDHCIVRIRRTGKGVPTLYKHPQYHTPSFTVQRSTEPGYEADVLADGQVFARFKTLALAHRWVAKLTT